MSTKTDPSIINNRRLIAEHQAYLELNEARAKNDWEARQRLSFRHVSGLGYMYITWESGQYSVEWLPEPVSLSQLNQHSWVLASQVDVKKDGEWASIPGGEHMRGKPVPFARCTTCGFHWFKLDIKATPENEDYAEDVDVAMRNGVLHGSPTDFCNPALEGVF